MVKNFLGWRTIDDLAKKYYEEKIKNGKGTSVDNRSPSQIQIVNEIVYNTRLFFQKIAADLLYKEGFDMHVHEDIRHFSLKGSGVDLNELVNEGILKVITSFHNYNPNKGRASNFIAINAVSGMVCYAKNAAGPVEISDYCFNSCFPLIKGNRKGLDAIKRISEELDIPAYQAGFLYMGITRNYIESSEIVQGMNEGPTSFVPELYSSTKIMNVYCPIEGLESEFFVDDSTPYTFILNKEMRENLCDALKTIYPKEANIIVLRWGIDTGTCKTLDEVSQLYNVTGTRIRQIELKALKKLRHPVRTKQIKDYI